MSKRLLMLSTATAALITGAAFADTTISSDTTTALTTGALLTSGEGTANAGNITIDSGDSVKISTESIGAITIDTSHWLYSDGTIKNSGVDYARGVHVDVSASPNLSGASFVTSGSATITGAGIYLDSASTLDLTGDGTGKYAVFFDASSGAGTYKGDVTVNGGAISVKGKSSYGFYFSDNTTFVGDLTFGGSSSLTMTEGSSTGFYFASGSKFVGDLILGSSSTITMSYDSNVAINIASGSKFTGNVDLNGTITLYQETVRSTTSSSLQALTMQGTLDGDFTVGGSINVIGAGATGITLGGYGVSGAVTINGTVATQGYSSTYDTSTSNYTTSSITTYPEASSALVIGADIDNGMMVSSSGSVKTNGTGVALAISSGSSSVTQSAALTIGLYKLAGDYDTYNPGFSFYNRGTISAQPMNYNNSAEAISIVGTSNYDTVLTGGFYNAGSVSATATTNDDKATAVTAVAISLGAYTKLDKATFDYTTGTWSDVTLASKNPGDQAKAGDQAAFVNAGGSISASVSGYQAGAATALYIAKYATVPSLINTGTIAASALSSKQDLTTVISSSNPYSLYANAIYDASGSLTSIYNTGTISAAAGVGTSSSTTLTALDSDKQIAIAIDLSGGNTATPSGSGVTITERATATAAASITGDIYFGTGDNQVIDIQGTSTSYTASIVGDVAYGATGTSAIADTLRIGAYGFLKGKVTAGSGPGLNVNVASNGALYLLNDKTSLNAASVHVADSGIISIAVSQSKSLSDNGTIDSKGTVILDKGSKLYLSYNSFVPQGSHDFVLITAPQGDIQIDTATISVTNTYLTKNVSDNGYLPYLFKSANLEVTSSTSAGDALVLHVTPKTATELGLAGYAKQLFPYVNTALSVDDELGSAMIYGINNGEEAQSAYAAFAPNVTGGSRAAAIAITDQSTGAVAARQRSLLMYAKAESGTSMWANEFVLQIKDPGTGAELSDGMRALSGFKDTGFGLSVGIDTGTPKYGWYGAAFTFYAGDVGELKRNSKTHTQWLLLSGYSVWRGKGLFFDSKIDVGYGQLDGKRTISLVAATSSSSYSIYSRTAYNKHDGALLSGGFSTGTYLNYGAMTISPTLAVDGLILRENGYTESNPGTATTGDAFDLKVQPAYARSLRAFLGLDLRYDLQMWDFFLQPELRGGYRYDFFSDPQKLKTAFAYADTSGAYPKAGEQFTITGPDPAKGSLVLGGSLAATTEAWTLGFHFDFVRGNNGAVEQVGTLSMVGKI